MRINHWKKHVNKSAARCCRNYRINILKVSQKQVAIETGYSKETISQFERGLNNNLTIFLWYVQNGLLNEYEIEQIVGWWL